MAKAACKGKDPFYWYPKGTPTQAIKRAEKGLRICANCPVQQECLSYAMENEAYGTWGGVDEVDREIQRHREGRPLLMTAKDRHKKPKLRDLTSA